MKNIHLVTPFSRHKLKDTLIETYRPMGILWHPIMFEDEAKKSVFNESWIESEIIPGNAPRLELMVGTKKVNHFIKNHPINDEDYYVAVADDDMYGAGVFDAIRQMDDDIVIISLKRGDFIPIGLPEERRYPTTTLYAHPDNVKIGNISGEQIFVKGRIFKEYFYDESNPCSDGIMAEWLKSRFRIRYEPDLFALFNYYEPGRWDKGNHKIAFGCMVNNLIRLDMILRNSAIENIPCYTIMDPESATKGLNKLLDIIESKGAEIGILTHQDMFYREHWLGQMQSQLALLPDNWVIAGIVGKDKKGELCGHFHDMSSPLWIISDHKFPVECSCIDESVIIVNMKSGFRFDEALEGFDLYGTYAVLRAKEMGTVWIIDAWAEHYCTRFHNGWEPDDRFKRMWKFLYERFPGQRLDSTIIAERQE